MSTITCARCKATLDDSEAYWGSDGQICLTCMDAQERSETFLKGLQASAWTALAAGVCGLFLNWFFVPGLIAIGAGTFSVNQMVSKDPEEKLLIKRVLYLWFPSVVGLALGIFVTGLTLLWL